MSGDSINEDNMLYAFFDGDDIGTTIEILLLEDRIADAIAFSTNLNDVNKEIKIMLNSRDGIEIIILGGDDLLIKFDSKKYGQMLIEEIRAHYKSKTGTSLSCGIGKSIPESIQNLRLAKLYGKNQTKGLT